MRADLGLVDAVHFLVELQKNYLPDEVVADFYRISDALFFPSREEGFGIPLIEAGFSHLPAFCADIHALRQLGLQDAAFFSPDEDPAQVANLLAEYFRSSPVARLSLRVRSEFRWEAIYARQIAPLLV